ncbi:hypothetical protein [Acinetobacter towneri]|uniref:hypothetical protein n=1 Tax=Acinetobacter towneri TaxID=202956 RepID=UPI00336BF4BF
MKKLVSVVSIALFSASYAYAECKTVPVITGEFASETLFDPTKTQVKYEKVCSKPTATTGEFIVDPTTLEVKKGQVNEIISCTCAFSFKRLFW